MRSFAWILSAAIASLALSACGRSDKAGQDANAPATANGDLALPKPEAKGGSVTGMPSRPGPNPVGPALAAEAPDEDGVQDADTADSTDEETAADDAEDDVAVDEGEASDESPAAATEPSTQDAVAVLRDYYAAINRQDFQQAWSAWSDGGRSSGQTPQQFADGFAGTAQVALQVGAPGPMEGAAGSRYIEIPVTIDATQRDGSVRRYIGSYTLRRAMVDGATDVQRAWHIASASLHPVAP